MLQSKRDLSFFATILAPHGPGPGAMGPMTGGTAYSADTTVNCLLCTAVPVATSVYPVHEHTIKDLDWPLAAAVIGVCCLWRTVIVPVRLRDVTLAPSPATDKQVITRGGRSRDPGTS